MKKIYLLIAVIIVMAVSGYVASRIHARSVTEAEARKFHCRTCQCQKFSIRDPRLPRDQWTCVDCGHSAAEHGVQ